MKFSPYNKYSAIKVTEDGILFDSRAEWRRYLELKLLLRAGIIKNLKTHVLFDCVINGILLFKYETDFTYQHDKYDCLEDVKGVETGGFVIKFKTVRVLFPEYKMFLYKRNKLFEFVYLRGKFKKIESSLINKTVI